MNDKRLARMQNRKASWKLGSIGSAESICGFRKNGEDGFIVLPQGLVKSKKKDFAHKMPEVLKLKGHTSDIADSAMNWTESNPYKGSTNGGFNSRGWDYGDTGVSKFHGNPNTIKGGKKVQHFR